MKIGIIIKPNQKGQIVIPKEVRKALGIRANTPLNILQRGYGIYIYPIKELVGESQNEAPYLAILERTKGAWNEDWEGVRKKRKEIELLASKKRRKLW